MWKEVSFPDLIPYLQGRTVKARKTLTNDNTTVHSGTEYELDDGSRVGLCSFFSSYGPKDPWGYPSMVEAEEPRFYIFSQKESPNAS